MATSATTTETLSAFKSKPVVAKPVFSRLMVYTFAHRRLLVQALGFLIVFTVADVLGPLLIKVFIDDYLVPGDWRWQPIALLAACYIFANGMAALFGYLQAVSLNQIAQQVVMTLRQQLFSHVLRLPVKKFDYTPLGSLISRITNDTEAVKDLFVGVLGVYVQNIIRVLGIFIAMGLLNWRLMLVCGLFLPMVVLVMAVYRSLSTAAFRKARELLADINASLNETIQGMPVVQLFNQQQRYAKKFHRTTQEHFLVRLKTMQLDALLLRPMVDFLYLITLAALLYYFGISSFSDSESVGMLSGIEIGVLYAFVNYLGRFTEPLIEMTQRLSLFQQAMVSADRVFQWLDEPIERPDQDPVVSIRKGDVRFSHVSFSYDEKKNVLNDINLSLPAGSFTGIVGHTGSGKSTLASLLMRFYNLEEGVIYVDGHKLHSLPMAELRKHLALVQQDSFIFSGTIADNIAIGRPLSEKQIERAAKKAGLHDYIASLPDTYQTLLAERGSNLSLGQRQLLSLTRAIVGEPKILILDEATANIDSETEEQVQQALLNLKGEVTLITIAHRLSTVTQADQIIVLHQGEIKQQGTHPQLLAYEGLYRHMYQLQMAPASLS